MIVDYMDEFTWDSTSKVSDQAFIGAAATAILGAKVKDGGAAGDWAAGEQMKAILRVQTAFVGATGGVQFDIVTDTAVGLATAPVVLATRTIPTASLVVNSLFLIGILAPGTRKQFLGLKVTPLTTATTAGRAIVGLQPAEDATPENRVASI